MNMQRINLVLLVFLGLVSFSGLAQAQTADARPRVSIDRMSHDFGELRQGRVVKTTFKLTNSGDAPLLVRQIYPTCGCTAVLLKSRRLAPGETRPLTVTLDTAKKRGEISNPITIITDDPDQPQIKLFILADVRVYVELMPGRVQLTHIKPGDSGTATLRLKNNSAIAIHILDLFSSRPEISAAAEHLYLKPGQSTTITVRIALPLQAGSRFTGRIIIRTDHPDYKKLRLPVTVLVWGGQHRLPTMDKRLSIPKRPKSAP